MYVVFVFFTCVDEKQQLKNKARLENRRTTKRTRQKSMEPPKGALSIRQRILDPKHCSVDSTKCYIQTAQYPESNSFFPLAVLRMEISTADYGSLNEKKW